MNMETAIEIVAHIFAIAFLPALWFKIGRLEKRVKNLEARVR